MKRQYIPLVVVGLFSYMLYIIIETAPKVPTPSLVEIIFPFISHGDLVAEPEPASIKSKYVGTHSGRWEGNILNQYNQGSATFTVKESGNAELVLSGKFSATHKGKIKNNKFISDKYGSRSIVDQGGGFKIVLISTGVNVDVMF